MGCADKTRIPIGGCDHSRPRHGPAAVRNARDLILNANGDIARFADTRLRSSPTACRVIRARSPAFSPGSILRLAQTPDIAWIVSVPERWPVPAARSCSRDCIGREARPARRSPARVRARAAPVVALWPVSPARGSAARADARGHAQGRRMERRYECGIAEWPSDAGRSVLQRQHAGRSRRSRAAGGTISGRHLSCEAETHATGFGLARE